MNQDYTETSVYLVVGLMILFILLEKFFLGFFISGWKWIVMFALFPLIYIPPMITDNVLFWWMNGVSAEAQGYLEILVKSTNGIRSVHLGEISHITNFSIGAVNEFLTTLFSPYLLVFFVYYLYKNSTKREFRRLFDVDSLIRDQADLWPQIKPMIEVFPHKIDNLDEGPWAMGMQPKHFAEKHNLIEHSENRMGEKKMTLKEPETIKIFREQLGKEWTNTDDLTQDERFILGILILKANRKGKEADKLIDLIGYAYTSEKKYSKSQLKGFMDVALKTTDEAIQRFKKSEVLETAVAQHYYVKTVLPRMLEFARNDGVLATSAIVWLKIRNRELYYMLNNVGRNSAWIEIAGIWHHYNYEKAIERKIPSPNISGAVASLDWEFRYCSDEYVGLPGYNQEK